MAKDTLEFYDVDQLILVMESSMVPVVDSYISIRGQTWRIVDVSFAADHSDDHLMRRMRCNIQLELPTQGE